MKRTTNWCRIRPLLLTLLLRAGVFLPTTPAVAQAQTVGDGLKGDYYEGTDFERFVLSRRDASVNFNWGQQPPAPGMPAESFSVRWTGWVVPPVGGRYIFHVTVDDGIRIWVNDKLIINEWRGQAMSTYTAAVVLAATQPCRLRIEYCQYGLDSRALVTWERPDALTPPASWRNLWGATAKTPVPTPIPTQFLFRENPRPLAKPPLGPQPRTTTDEAQPQRVGPTRAKQPAKATAKPAVQTMAKATAKATKQPIIELVPKTVQPAPAPVLEASEASRTARLASLAVGDAMTLPELYFDQGQARLLPAARAPLEELAAVLRAQPGLRFEVQGHTDNVGNAELNRQLSQQRAEAVCLYLTAQGVAAAQLRPVGYGGSQPVADNADPAQRPLNRRVVLRRR